MNRASEQQKAQEREAYNQFKEGLQTVVNMHGRLNPSNAAYYYMFFENKDKKEVKSTIKTVVKYHMVSILGGIVLNRIATKINSFARLYSIFRVPLRLGLFYGPNLLFFNQYARSYNFINDTWQKYDKRVLNYMKTGDFKYLDPEGVVFREVLQGSMEFGREHE